MAATPTRSNHPMPFTRIELAVFAVRDGSLQVLLARRAEAPHAGRWALPGGVLRVDLDTSLEAAAQRVAGERLGASLPVLRQLCAVGGPQRDPRAPWALSVVYRGLVPADAPDFTAGKRIESLAWRNVDDAMSAPLAFDHATLVGEAMRAMREDIDTLDLPLGCLPASFTLGELQSFCEQVLGHPLDKSSFRRRLADRGILVPVEGEFRVGAFRPAQLYRAAEVAS